MSLRAHAQLAVEQVRIAEEHRAKIVRLELAEPAPEPSHTRRRIAFPSPRSPAIARAAYEAAARSIAEDAARLVHDWFSHRRWSSEQRGRKSFTQRDADVLAQRIRKLTKVE